MQRLIQFKEVIVEAAFDPVQVHILDGGADLDTGKMLPFQRETCVF
jgi:hypothetical protein